jgi:hypothetical protein
MIMRNKLGWLSGGGGGDIFARGVEGGLAGAWSILAFVLHTALMTTFDRCQFSCPTPQHTYVKYGEGLWQPCPSPPPPHSTPRGIGMKGGGRVVQTQGILPMNEHICKSNLITRFRPQVFKENSLLSF